MVSKVNQILESDLGSFGKWNAVLECLIEHKLSYRQAIHPSQVCCHPSNRAGLGVSWQHAHAIGAAILKSGADQQMLIKATCFEMSSDRVTHQQQVAYNEKLVSSSNGYLAQLTGNERFLSVSCSHTVPCLRQSCCSQRIFVAVVVVVVVVVVVILLFELYFVFSLICDVKFILRNHGN